MRCELDLDEGADLVMVKPAGAYLDVDPGRGVTRSTCPSRPTRSRASMRWSRLLPRNGWIDRDRAIAETLTAIKRAGADIVLTYWATEVASHLH